MKQTTPTRFLREKLAIFDEYERLVLAGTLPSVPGVDLTRPDARGARAHARRFFAVLREGLLTGQIALEQLPAWRELMRILHADHASSGQRRRRKGGRP